MPPEAAPFQMGPSMLSRRQETAQRFGEEQLLIDPGETTSFTRSMDILTPSSSKFLCANRFFFVQSATDMFSILIVSPINSRQSEGQSLELRLLSACFQSSCVSVDAGMFLQPSVIWFSCAPDFIGFLFVRGFDSDISSLGCLV